MLWEYKVINRGNWREDEVQTQLNALGSEGWELVSFQIAWFSCMFVLKRPKA